MPLTSHRACSFHKLDFSAVTEEDLKKAGVARGFLLRVPEKVNELERRFGTNPGEVDEMADLYSRVQNIYRCANMEARLFETCLISSSNRESTEM